MNREVHFLNFIWAYRTIFSEPFWVNAMDGLCTLVTYKITSLYYDLYTAKRIKVIGIDAKNILVPAFRWQGHNILQMDNLCFDPTAQQMGFGAPQIFSADNPPKAYGNPNDWFNQKIPRSYKSLIREIDYLMNSTHAYAKIHGKVVVASCDTLYKKTTEFLKDLETQEAEFDELLGTGRPHVTAEESS